MGRLKIKVKARNGEDWEEEIHTKSTLKWYKLVKNSSGVAR